MGLDLTRREVLWATGALAGCFVLGGSTMAFASDTARIRPPGGQDEARLRALCLKCDRCRSACPQGIITSVSIGEDVLGARTPQLDFHEGYCDFCGKCQEVCLTQALAPSFDPGTEKLGIVRLDTSLCLAYSASCVKCWDSCDYGALNFDEKGHPVIDAGLCNGCGSCVSVCQSNIAGLYSGRTRALEVVYASKGDE